MGAEFSPFSWGFQWPKRRKTPTLNKMHFQSLVKFCFLNTLLKIEAENEKKNWKLVSVPQSNFLQRNTGSWIKKDIYFGNIFMLLWLAPSKQTLVSECRTNQANPQIVGFLRSHFTALDLAPLCPRPLFENPKGIFLGELCLWPTSNQSSVLLGHFLIPQLFCVEQGWI